MICLAPLLLCVSVLASGVMYRPDVLSKVLSLLERNHFLECATLPPTLDSGSVDAVLTSTGILTAVYICMGAQWLNGRVLDLRLKGRGFEPLRHHRIVVLEQDTFILA